MNDFIKAVDRLKSKGGLAKKIFVLLRDTFITWLVERESGSLLQAGGIVTEQLERIHHRWLDTLKQLRPNLITIVDAFMIRDGMLVSTLGHSKGGIYERIMHHVKENNPTAGKDSYEGFE